MPFSFSSLGHKAAALLSDAYVGMKALEGFIVKVDTPANRVIVESLTSLIPTYGPPAATIERGVFAIAGELASILTNVTNGGEQKLIDAGFDAKLITEFRALISAVPGLVKPSPAPAK